MPVISKYKSALRAAAVTLCVIAALWVVACAGIYWVMCQPPEKFARVMSSIPEPVPFLVLPFGTLWKHARSGTLVPGDPAPDFALVKLDKSDHVRLSSFAAQGQPVVLVFGSYT